MPHKKHQAIIMLFCLLFSASITGEGAQAGNSAALENGQMLRPWQDYQVIMWIGDTAGQKTEKMPLFIQRLREMGVNTGMVFGDANPKPMVDNKFPYYVENLVNRGLCLKFNSNVRDWSKMVSDWAQNGRPTSAFNRDYCLDDLQWRDWARSEVVKIVEKNRPHSPLAYNLRDELSVTFSANPFDYDFSPVCLAQFREWLKTQYKSLADLNSGWDTQFKTWEEVRPFSTDQIKARMSGGDPFQGSPDWQAVRNTQFDPALALKSPKRWNLAPWMDFRTYMDISLARALDYLRLASHEVDLRTPVGIEGTQMPHAFGGYDLWRLSRVLDWIEPYDIGNSREILASFMEKKPVLTTLFESDTDHALRRLWHLLLTGDRGCIVWWSEDMIDWKSEDYALTSKAKALAPALSEMRSPLAHLFMRANPVVDPIYILYSQPSIQVDWLMESTVDGATWQRRFSSYESENNRMIKIRNAWLKALQDVGWTPQFISSEQLASGILERQGNAVLVLPTAWALSEKECSRIQAFLKPSSGTRMLLFDGHPGQFNEHGRLCDNPVIQNVASTNDDLATAWGFGGAPVSFPGNFTEYLGNRLKKEATPDFSEWIQNKLKTLPLFPSGDFMVELPPQHRVRIHRYQLGEHLLVAFERNVDYQMNEDLKQAGGNEPLEKPIELDAQLSGTVHVYDLRTEKHLGETNQIHFTLSPWRPSLFVLTKKQFPDGSVVSALGENKDNTH